MSIGIDERVLQTAQYIAETGATVRDAAKQFGISKSTVHKDMTERLVYLDKVLAGIVYEKLQINKAQRHIRGGLATHNKYKNQLTANDCPSATNKEFLCK